MVLDFRLLISLCHRNKYLGNIHHQLACILLHSLVNNLEEVQHCSTNSHHLKLLSIRVALISSNNFLLLPLIHMPNNKCSINHHTQECNLECLDNLQCKVDRYQVNKQVG